MNSQFVVAAWDAPQTRPAKPPSLPQITEWRQQGRPTARIADNVVFVHRYRQTGAKRDLWRQVRSLQQYYTIVDSDRIVTELIGEEPALFALLLEAVRPLRMAFGEKRLIYVRVQFSDDDTLLRVAVQLPVSLSNDQAERALRSFDEHWWLKNCQRSGGALVFDYEIQDAV